MKKGAIDLSVRFIVIIVLVLSFLVIGLGFIDKSFQEGALKFEQHIISGAPGPPIEIANPDSGYIAAVGDPVKFELVLLGPSVKMEGWWWDFEDDGHIDSTQENPEWTYYEPGDYNTKVRGINKQGGLGEDSVMIRVFTNNEKKGSKYSSETVFFIHAESAGDTITNWRELLLAIPLTRWFDNAGDHNYGMVAIAKSTGDPVTENDIERKLTELGKSKAVLLDFEIAGSTYDWIDFYDTTDGPAQYFDQWGKYNSVVVTDYDNEDGGLIAALFAAYYNAPLVFVNDGNKDDYKPYIDGKKVYTIDTISTNIGSWNVIDKTPYTSDELRNPETRVNRLVELHSEPST